MLKCVYCLYFKSLKDETPPCIWHLRLTQLQAQQLMRLGLMSTGAEAVPLALLWAAAGVWQGAFGPVRLLFSY